MHEKKETAVKRGKSLFTLGRTPLKTSDHRIRGGGGGGGGGSGIVQES